MMKKRVTFMVICLLLATVAAGHAQVKANSFSVTPFVGGYTFEGNSNFKTAPVFGLRGAYHFTKHLGLEGFFNYVPTENTALTSNADVKLYGGGIEGLYHFMPDSRFVPFVAVGVGGTRYSPAGGVKERDRFTVDYGAGVKYFLTENLALRADVRHIILPLNDRFNELLYTVGINFAFGGAKKAEPSVMTTRAAEPAAAPAPAVVVVKDSDGDGVVDDLDKCPGTPAGVKVDRDGCPLDSDGDGVYDYLDKCPGTPAGVEVDQDGCPLPVVQTMAPQAASAVEAAIVEKGRVTLKVKFDFDKAVVKKNYHEEIARLAAVLKKYPDLRIAIEGHTDNVGGAAYNEKLSQRRADAVKNVLTTKFGVKESRMETKGYGQTRPIGSNATKEGRRMNRRVEAAADYIIRK
jgi:OOP family OmpA-OmpF porin